MELKAGQKWITRNGAEVTLEADLENHAYWLRGTPGGMHYDPNTATGHLVYGNSGTENRLDLITLVE